MFHDERDDVDNDSQMTDILDEVATQGSGVRVTWAKPGQLSHCSQVSTMDGEFDEDGSIIGK